MNLTNLAKTALKGLITLVVIALLSYLAVGLLPVLGNVQLLLGVGLGAGLFQPLYSLFAQFNLLQ